MIGNGMAKYDDEMKEKDSRKRAHAISMFYKIMSLSCTITKSEHLKEVISNRQKLFDKFCLDEKRREYWFTELRKVIAYDEKEVVKALTKVTLYVEKTTKEHIIQTSAHYYKLCIGYPID